MIQSAIARACTCTDLSIEEAESVMNEIISGQATGAQIGAFITAMRMKGETEEEIAALASVMRARAIPIDLSCLGPAVDTCGTGGDRKGTFNISTAAGLVCAAAGVPVIKHGGRSVSSRCGSADLLAELGIDAEAPLEEIRDLYKKTGFAFLYAPRFHPAMRHAASARQECGIASIFNLLGPLLNPARVDVQLLGVSNPELTVRIAGVLKKLKSRRAMIVCGGGYDEITTTGETVAAVLDNGRIERVTLCPEDFGIKRASPDDLLGGGAAENAAIIREILSGERGAPRDIVLLNAAAAIHLGGGAEGMKEGLLRAAEAVDSGRAEEVLMHLSGKGGRER